MRYFKIIYMLSGKYKSIYHAKILLWADGKVRIRDEDDKEYLLKEEYIKSVITIKPQKYKDNEEINIYEQQELF